MAVADGEIIKVVVDWDLPDVVVAENVYYWEMSDPSADNPTNAQIITALDSKLTALYETIDDLLATDVLVDEFSVEKVEWDPVAEFWETVENVGGAPLAVAGLDTTDMLPHGVAATITAQTARPQTRARKFIPGFAENTVEESTWTGALLTALALFVIEWLTDKVITGDAEIIPVVLGQSGPSAGLVFSLVSAGANAIAGYQRRRKPGVGS